MHAIVIELQALAQVTPGTHPGRKGYPSPTEESQMSKTDRQQEQLKNVSGGGQTPGTNWGATPGEATNSTDNKKTVPHTQRGNEEPGADGDDKTRIESDD